MAGRYTPVVAQSTGARLLAWFTRHRRGLPWRAPFPRDPYPTLVSEVMLQQTQVERVVPLFARFIERFPTVAALADADEHDVLLAFSGLGYYRRARLLHAAARAVVAAGAWPRTPSDLRQLPGVGAYTAAAVAAFSFAGTEPPVDGNIARVAARLGALEARLGSRALSAAAARLAAGLFAETHTPAVWEALMELGATVCTAAAPQCNTCPMASACAAHAQGRAAALPLPRPTRATEKHRWIALWLRRRDGNVLVARVPAGEPLAGLWLVPYACLSPDQDPQAAARALARRAGCRGALTPRPPLRHAITFRDIAVFPFMGGCAPRAAEADPERRWVDPLRPDVAVPTLFTKLRHSCGDDARDPARRLAEES